MHSCRYYNTASEYTLVLTVPLLTEPPQIPLDHPKQPPLPLSDISCGGWEMSDQPGRYHFLWGVSQQGQVSVADPPQILLLCFLCLNSPAYKLILHTH